MENEIKFFDDEKLWIAVIGLRQIAKLDGLQAKIANHALSQIEPVFEVGPRRSHEFRISVHGDDFDQMIGELINFFDFHRRQGHSCIGHGTDGTTSYQGRIRPHITSEIYEQERTKYLARKRSEYELEKRIKENRGGEQ